ncbi:hydrogenase-4 transcriptional activator [Salmonella enterica subsp. enterica serovar Choleraesuis]|nr:hydrogenase-4 transcriptional activator [Salmonella enterica subsp. enterica serovar Choleraesuis]
MGVASEITTVQVSNSSWERIVTGLVSRFTSHSDNGDLLRAFFPLPAGFSQAQFLELQLEENLWYRCFSDGRVEKTAHRWRGNCSASLEFNIPLADRTCPLSFIRTDGGSFTDSDRQLYGWMARLAAPALAGLQTRHNLVEQCRALSHERDDHRILVDITNSVLSHLDMDDLVSKISREIHRFFAIPAISLALREANNPLHYASWASRYDDADEPCHKRHTRQMEGSYVSQVLSSMEPLRLALTDDTATTHRDPLLKSLADSGMRVALLLPLAFGEKAPGVLILAHSDHMAFNTHDCRLLGQIASRIGIAITNANAWQEINHLKENLKQENIWLNAQIHNTESFSDIIYQSDAMKQVLMQLEMVANSDSTVLLLGETGTGKELMARALHNLSSRSKQTMIKMNCAAVPASLLESDLFGHEKGAFTGATTTHTGRFEMAQGGTLFLDEIGDMPLELQPKLLRVLQEREIERLGGNRVIPVDVRVIAATNRDLHQMVQDREFRSDLFYRLNVFPIVIPPLRERPEDIPLLAQYFTRKMASRMNRNIDTIPANAMRQLCRYPWPGNVRELQNVIERAVILTRGDVLNLQLSDLPAACASPTQHNVRAEIPGDFLRPAPPENDDNERQRILEALREANGIVAGPRGAANKLGLKRTTLLSRMQRLGINPRDMLT